MESKDEFLKIDIKNRTCCYFDDIMTVEDIYSSGILLNKKIFQLMTFCTKPLSVHNNLVLGLIK